MRSHVQPTLRTLAVCVLIASVAVAAGQTTSTGADYASINLSLDADLGEQLALRLPVSVLVFDLGAQEANAVAGLTCVVGATAADPVVTSAALAAPTVAPAGITVSTAGSEVRYGGALLTDTSPTLGNPRQVCFRDFALAIFANVPGWQLIVDRVDDQNDQAIEHLYVAWACGSADGVGFRRLEQGATATLLQTTQAGECRDVRVVVGVKPALEQAGVSTATLRYTLISSTDLLGGATQ